MVILVAVVVQVVDSEKTVVVGSEEEVEIADLRKAKAEIGSKKRVVVGTVVEDSKMQQVGSW